MSISWDTSDFDSRIRQVIPKLVSSAGKGVGEAGSKLLELSSAAVPVKTGALQKSGRVAAKGLEANVSYNTSYAVKVHEGHSRGAKYLETPLKQNVSLFKNIITNQIKAKLT